MSDKPPLPAPALPRPSIDGTYTMFYYRNQREAVRWYEEVLGFERVLSITGADLFRIHAHSHLALIAEGHGSQKATSVREKGAILSIQTSALEEWHARLFALGVEGTGVGTVTGGDGTTVEFKVYDPGGYTVEFFDWIC